ncbi:MAG: TadE/TadG family protein [Rhodobacteraceae bacterium]|nr:TadE/TadG family protein [Paracoccaceae bacterium]
MAGKLTILRQLARDDEGNMLAMGALGLIVVAALVGGGVDMSRAYKVQSRLQAACDAGVLAGRKAVAQSGFDSNAENEANAFFDNNFDEDEQGASGTTFTPTSDDDGNTILGTASTGVTATVMRIFGYSTIDLQVTCSASMGVGNSDVTMVLDTTGSMNDPLERGGDSKLSMLQDAMKSFYDTLSAATAGGNTRVRYAFVPYSSSVNVGHLLYELEPDYLVDSWQIQSRQPIFETTTVNNVDYYQDPVTTTGTGESAETLADEGYYGSASYDTQNECLSALPGNTGWSNSGSSSSDDQTIINDEGQQVTTTTVTQPQSRTEYSCVRVTTGKGKKKTTTYDPYYRTYTRNSYAYTYETADPVYVTVENSVFDHWLYTPVTYDVSDYKAFDPVTVKNGENGTDASYTWDGCIEERETTPAASFHYNSLSGVITPVSAIDLDIDTAPDGDDATKWAPMWPEVAYYRTSFVDYGRGRGRYDLSNNHDSLTGSQANSFCPPRAQLLQTMTEDAFDDYADALTAQGSTYHDFGILWGARISSPQGIFQDNVNEAPGNGGNVARHMIFMTDGAMSTSNAIQSMYGIEFHDRRVTANGVNLQNDRHTSRFLALCEAVKAKGIRLWVIAFSTGLTDDLESCASDNSAFTAEDSDELNSAFQEIASEVGELRIVQ